jgi:hypothetical protein
VTGRHEATLPAVKPLANSGPIARWIRQRGLCAPGFERFKCLAGEDGSRAKRETRAGEGEEIDQPATPALFVDLGGLHYDVSRRMNSMPDNEAVDIQALIERLRNELQRMKSDPDPLAQAAMLQALALEHIALELNKFNFREKNGPGAS